MLSSTLQGRFQTQFKQVTSRKLFEHADVLFNRQLRAAASAPAANPTTASSDRAFSSLHADVVMILAALICALICALIVNAVVRCVCIVAGCERLETEGGSNNHPCDSEEAGGPFRARVQRKRAVRSLPCFAYAPGDLGVLMRSGTECVICLSEFAPGERVRVLPKCGHGFHVRCIDRWLASRSSCPTCRQSLLWNDKEAGRQEEPPVAAAGLGESGHVVDERRMSISRA